MLALINTDEYEEVMEDLGSKCDIEIVDRDKADKAFEILEAYATEGSTEEFLYRELDELVRVANNTTRVAKAIELNEYRNALLSTLGHVSNDMLEEIAGMSIEEIQVKLDQFNS